MSQYDQLHIEDYNYPLPEDRIAKYPLPRRDASKLLIYRLGEVSSAVFRDLPEYLPVDASLVFNETKVVPARLHFRRQSGAVIEIFCLEPVLPTDYNQSFACTQTCRWRCVIGNAKRWKGDTISLINTLDDSHLSLINLRASLIERSGQTGIVDFIWDSGGSFSEVLDLCGKIPIPPYLGRETEDIDLERYQTTYARLRGSVAAPTAGLHFTPEVLEEVRAHGIALEKVCLHVGAGTFLPVKTSLVREHEMHREPFSVSLELLRKLVKGGRIVAVGTTSVRTLESLYYVGVGILETGRIEDVSQTAPYDREYPYSTVEALQAIVDYLAQRGLTELKVGTRIIIVPGFRFRIVDMLVTNFHQPQSTLLLLISAFVGGDWRTIYDYALSHGFRFLSYGDSSLLFRRD